ncbi:hypothetical protein B0H17DRAFT_1149892 [Mycena rosella]|uniref:Uncharacterized protein n=1 Tax=Mycena rosella TaxID=1033263 RepID=A0AAD7BY48_MYCRO|nr:hypothetical protein B0H17DRAFT_1149892 [Mycena rosella]
MRRAGTHPPPRVASYRGVFRSSKVNLAEPVDTSSAIIRSASPLLSVDNGTNTQGPNAAGTEANFDIQYAMERMPRFWRSSGAQARGASALDNIRFAPEAEKDEAAGEASSARVRSAQRC